MFEQLLPKLRLLYSNTKSIFSPADGAHLQQQTQLISFEHAPFPLKQNSAAHQEFFDRVDNGRYGHTSKRGGIYWEDETYCDNRVLISIPPHFKFSQDAVIVVFFHGNQAQLERDVVQRQNIPQQVAESGLNAILVAPQFALDALDSSPGRFAEDNFFARFLKEVAEQTAHWQQDSRYQHQLSNADVILVAYSGGYLPTAKILAHGGTDDQISGIILMDALYGEEQTFANFILDHPIFFFSCFTEGAQINNENLQDLLREHEYKIELELSEKFQQKTSIFVRLGYHLAHQHVLSNAWVCRPLTDLLQRASV